MLFPYIRAIGCSYSGTVVYLTCAVIYGESMIHVSGASCAIHIGVHPAMLCYDLMRDVRNTTGSDAVRLFYSKVGLLEL